MQSLRFRFAPLWKMPGHWQKLRIMWRRGTFCEAMWQAGWRTEFETQRGKTVRHELTTVVEKRNVVSKKEKTAIKILCELA